MFYGLYKALEKPEVSRYGNLLQRAILFNVIINIAITLNMLFLDIPSEIKSKLFIIESITVVLFVIELITRYVVIGNNVQYKGFLGRLKFTFTPFILIDILSLLSYVLVMFDISGLLLRVARFLRFFRALRLIRLNNVIKNLFSFNYFATSSISVQFVILFIFSILFIILFAFILHDEKLSIMLFLSPSAVAEVQGYEKLLYGIIELILGLIIGGALISIITELLNNVSTNIRNGYQSYRGKNHIVIINNNPKMEFVLDEINAYYQSVEKSKDIVLFLPFINDVEAYSQKIKDYINIKVHLVKGEAFTWSSYEKLSINTAEKVLVLENSDRSLDYLNKKIVRYILTDENFKNEQLHFFVESYEHNDDLIYSQVFDSVKNSHNIINTNEVIQRMLSRSIISPFYFNLYSSLLSFAGDEFYILDLAETHKKEMLFKDIYMTFQSGVVLGVVNKTQKVILNPDKNFVVSPKEDCLIVILESRFAYKISQKNNSLQAKDLIIKPCVKVKRKVCIIGDNEYINHSIVCEFLDQESIKYLEFIKKENSEEYESLNFWNEIIEKNYDVIILNLNDNVEFMLTMYLKKIYKDNVKFLNSLVNVIRDPISLKLLYSSNQDNNIILSDKVTGGFLTQVLFNDEISHIFNEITSSKGNELYLLRKNKYAHLFDMNIQQLKIDLLESNMLYVGIMIGSEFFVNNEDLSKADSIVILTEGTI